MLDGTTTKAGKCWKKVHLEFICEQKRNSSDFLVSDIGQHEVILGGNWLKEYNPTINWATQVIQFTDDIANIASEEEADDNPLEGVPSQYHTYAKVFGEEEFTKLPPHRSYDIHIELVDEEMRINSPLYSMTDTESIALKEWLDKELAAGKIQPSNSSISSPVMFIPKKDGSRRLVVDYRKLNANTKKSVYPLPRPDDLMSKLRGAKIFSALDMRWGYNNLRVAEEDVPKTAFRTKYGLFETKVMPFGLTNAPAYFQHWVNSIFHDMLDVSVVIYLDDILIFSKNEEEHTQHVEEVLRRLQDNQLFCKASKCFFHRQELSYLGIRVSVDGFSLDPLKIQAVQEWPAPTNRKELQSFLGFANFLRRFAKDFSKIARPLNNLISPSAEWKWNIREQESFEELKRVITEAPVLAHADPNKTYYLETDASGAAMGAVLSQRQEDGRLHPIGFMSESFKGAELNWDTHDKELHAIIQSLEFWRIYLEVGLPKDMGHDAILVIIDSFSKYSIFVPTEATANAARIADLFLEHYWKNHGLPKKTVSDRGTVFQNKFTRALYKRLGINPHFSSAYHPESDGQTERVNPSIEHFLRIYCGHSRKDWVKWLPLAQFAYNNAPHSATSTSPFMCIYGREPTFSPSNIETEVPEANDRTNIILQIQEEVASALRLSKERMTKGKPEETPISFEVGERAWLDAKNINLKTTSSKLNDRRLGPFK
ncbi:putative Transposon Tf2-1 polyprotein, partial [Rhizoctonia solani 123E]